MALQAEQDKLQKSYRLHLNSIKNKHHLSDKEMALMMGMEIGNADLVRKMRAGNAKIQTCRIIQLSKNLIQEYGDASLLQELIPEDHMAYVIDPHTTNGRIDDEINNITLFCGKILEVIRRDGPLDTTEINDYAQAIASEAATIREEAK